jgi:predicted nuclease with TOPRIM domain
MNSKIFAEQVNARLRTLENENETLTESVKALTEKVDTLTERVDTLTERVDTLTAVVEHAVTGFWGLLSERYPHTLECSLHPSTCRQDLNLYKKYQL